MGRSGGGQKTWSIWESGEQVVVGRFGRRRENGKESGTGKRIFQPLFRIDSILLRHLFDLSERYHDDVLHA